MSAFDQSTTEQVPQQETTQAQPQSSTFESLVGEGKKFQSPEDLAKGKMEADQFIEQLKQEQAELREELSKRLTSEEVLEKIRENNQQQGQSQGDNTSPQLSEERLSELVKNTLESTRTEETKQNNVQSVDQQLVNQFGDKAGEWLNTKSQELGVSIAFLQDVASTSPAAFFNTVGLNNTNQQGKASVTTSTVNTETLGQVNTAGQPQQGTKKFFDQIKKENPRKYWTPEVQNQLFKARMELGEEKFYS
jgi:hypothetical protein